MTLREGFVLALKETYVSRSVCFERLLSLA